MVHSEECLDEIFPKCTDEALFCIVCVKNVNHEIDFIVMCITQKYIQKSYFKKKFNQHNFLF